MALDPNIILQVRPMDLGQVGDSFLKGAQFKNQQETQKLQNQLSEQQIAESKLKTLDAREQSRLKSVILGSAELKNYLESNDVAGAKNFLVNRKANLQKRIAAGDNVDTTETDEALQMLDSNPGQLKQNVDHITKFGQQLGVLSDPRVNEADLNLKKAQANYYNRRDSSGIGPGGSRAPVGYRYTPDGNLEAIKGGPYDKQDKPLPANIIKLQDDNLQTVGQLQIINKKIDNFINQIDSNQIDFGLFQNPKSKLQNYIGKSDEQSRNFNSFSSFIEEMRNGLLLLHNGVQTEGDAQRALNQLIADGGLNDKELVKERLMNIKTANENNAKLREMQNEQIRSEYGKNPLNYDNYNQGSNSQNNRKPLKDIFGN